MGGFGGSSGGFGGRMGGRGDMGGNFGGERPEGDFGDFDGQMPEPANGDLPRGDFGGFDGPDARQAEGADYEAMDGIVRAESAASSLSLSGTYETRQDYIDALNVNGEWVCFHTEIA